MGPDKITNYSASPHMIKLYSARTSHSTESFHEVTDPIRRRPPAMTRSQWREIQRQAHQAGKKARRENRRAEATN